MTDTEPPAARPEVQPVLARPGPQETLPQFQLRVLTALGLPPTQQLLDDLAREREEAEGGAQAGSRTETPSPGHD